MFFHVTLQQNRNIGKFSHTGFQNGFVDFNLSFDWLFVVQVRKVEEGLRTGRTGVTIEHAFTRTGCWNCIGFIKNGNQLQNTKKHLRSEMNIFKHSRQKWLLHQCLAHIEGFTCFIMPVVLQLAAFSHVFMCRWETKLFLQRWTTSTKQLSGPAAEDTQEEEVCAYEISGQMRSDNRMRSCQTQWHGCCNEMRPDTWMGDGGQRDDKQS